MSNLKAELDGALRKEINGGTIWKLRDGSVRWVAKNPGGYQRGDANTVEEAEETIKGLRAKTNPPTVEENEFFRVVDDAFVKDNPLPAVAGMAIAEATPEIAEATGKIAESGARVAESKTGQTLAEKSTEIAKLTPYGAMAEQMKAMTPQQIRHAERLSKASAPQVGKAVGDVAGAVGSVGKAYSTAVGESAKTGQLMQKVVQRPLKFLAGEKENPFSASYGNNPPDENPDTAVEGDNVMEIVQAEENPGKKPKKLPKLSVKSVRLIKSGLEKFNKRWKGAPWSTKKALHDAIANKASWIRGMVTNRKANGNFRLKPATRKEKMEIARVMEKWLKDHPLPSKNPSGEEVEMPNPFEWMSEINPPAEAETEAEEVEAEETVEEDDTTPVPLVNPPEDGEETVETEEEAEDEADETEGEAEPVENPPEEGPVYTWSVENDDPFPLKWTAVKMRRTGPVHVWDEPGDFDYPVFIVGGSKADAQKKLRNLWLHDIPPIDSYGNEDMELFNVDYDEFVKTARYKQYPNVASFYKTYVGSVESTCPLEVGSTPNPPSCEHDLDFIGLGKKNPDDGTLVKVFKCNKCRKPFIGGQ